ncbi:MULTISPECIES: hypothetical protein [unclassified Knoellia]|uniref:hypothetical protein n=1 Tax=Knoellia altitudinis TaxID=3404795 RepID=UPI003620D2EA
MRVVPWAVIGGLTSALLVGCGQVQADADAAAARVADQVLPEAVAAAITTSGARTPEQRAVAGETWLSEPDPAVTESQGGTTWFVRGREGTAIRLDVYARVESGSFLPPDQGQAAWGVACRSFDVGEKVTVTPVECPEGTPETP